MDLSLPLRSLIPSLDSDVLAVLVRTEVGLGATQIARLAERGSRQGVAHVLDRLVEHGLVLAQRTNVGHTYRFNRQHLLAPLLLDALEIRDRVRDLLVEQVATLDPPPVHVSVFGSFARGEGSTGSDIDLLVVVPEGHDPHDLGWVDQMRAVEARVLLATGNRLVPLVLDVAALRAAVDGGEPVVGSWSADSVSIMGPAFTALTRPQGVR